MTAKEIATSGPLPPATRRNHQIDLLEAPFAAGLQAANDSFVAGAQIWNALFTANLALFDAVRRAFGGLLIDWHQQFLGPADR